MTTKQKKRPKWLLPLLLGILTLIFGLSGWYVYDNTVDRSGWVQKEGIYYYQDFHARYLTGWQKIDEKTYHFSEEGAMLTRWQEIDGKRYWFGDSGAMATSWRDLEGGRYYFGSDGAMATGWQEIDGSRYYFEESGVMHTSWLDLEGSRYFFGDDGILRTGWLTLEDATYYLNADGTLLTGRVTMEDYQYYFLEDGTMFTGWEDTGEGRRFYHADGTMASGWNNIEGKLYYFDEQQLLYTGWLQDGEYRYYLQEDGSAAVGPTQIDGEQYYFSPQGIHVILVNRQNPVPDYYDLELKTYKDWHQVAALCLEPLRQMLADCVAAGNKFTFNSGYRSIATQEEILYLRTEEHMEEFFLSWEEAYEMALTSVAYPGTSEHHLGLAVDILGEDAIAWLTEHCWDYGFMVRYTAEKEHITGFIDEPWHFRYVGTRVSLDIKDTGLCLEEYLGAVEIEENDA